MVKFLIERPIGVIMSFIALMVFSFITFRLLPVSLLPAIDVPQIIVKVNAPNSSPENIEQNILSRVRESLITLNGLESMESKAGSENGTVRLSFEYGTAMELAYIEVNEKIDRLTNSLPRDLERPQVVRINTSDIPVVRVQVIPSNTINFIQASLLTENVLKKRLEQIEGVSLVDINGKKENIISVKPYKDILRSLNITENDITNAIRAGNTDLSNLNVQDGQYRYSLRMASRVDGEADIRELPVRGRDGSVFKLGRLAEVKNETKKSFTYHLFGAEEGLVITVHKQAQAKMNDLLPKIYEAIEVFKVDYPGVNFELTQDQSLLLNAGIDNLKTSLLFGGIFAFGVLFFFMGNYRMPIIIGISLPTSLLISFIVFYLFDISINIISLSGLALGLGMLIDNAIIVLDNITRKRKEGQDLISSCVEGVNEVTGALISSVLTTLAVFLPLVFLNGLSGALFFDQAVSVAAILSVSLLVAFILLPLLYKLFFSNQEQAAIKEDSRFYLAILKGYKKLFYRIFANKGISFILIAALIPLAIWLGLFLPKAGLPPIEKNETLININWNEPIDAEIGKQRVLDLVNGLSGEFLQAESDIGLLQFLLFDGENSVQQSSIYFAFDSQKQKDAAETKLSQKLNQNYPEASFEIADAPNAFDQLFSSNEPYLEARWKDNKSKAPIPGKQLNPMLEEITVAPWKRGPGTLEETAVNLKVDQVKLSLYRINSSTFEDQLNKLFGNFNISDIKRFGEVTPIVLKEDDGDFVNKINANFIQADSSRYPLSEFVSYDLTTGYKYVTADKTGIYQSIYFEEDVDVAAAQSTMQEWGIDHNFVVEFTGRYFSDQENLKQLINILLIAVLLLYFILAAQFESFVQPLIVVFTLPLGIGGAFLIIWLTGSSLNVMSAIGLVVMLGIMVNDAILKIDTINRLRKDYAAEDASLNPKQILEKAILKAGEIRLKPILMTSITTILALIPVIFSTGLGADLQRPLVYSVIGGLTIGTFTALYFIPLAYWFITPRSAKRAA